MRTSHGGGSSSRLFVAAVLGALTVAVAACSGPGAAPASAVPSVVPSPAAESVAPTLEPSEPAASASSGGGGRGGDYDYGTGTEASPEASTEPGGATVVNAASGSVGAYLTGANGLTLYTFKSDGANSSTCVDGCAQFWPPLTVGSDGQVEAGDGVGGALTTFARPDGSLQVAYNGAPLYYFANDTAPGDTNGQGLGGNWFVAAP